jgi:hypothetical protein
MEQRQIVVPKKSPNTVTSGLYDVETIVVDKPLDNPPDVTFKPHCKTYRIYCAMRTKNKNEKTDLLQMFERKPDSRDTLGTYDHVGDQLTPPQFHGIWVDATVKGKALHEYEMAMLNLMLAEQKHQRALERAAEKAGGV